ncbi:hypothetical protein TTHERM_01001460 (macronuclear) [Tetrahymena thermophila SB210]|uniref:PB1 domain protein n=1 Tax=Tetrahymena thermophila (strain SB210) TaxID=312017 RepID=Q24HH8_TETTS|nr:hypothetical protein TTHERM_01001460 [Tetrahymena thermophila SB210]EAS07253.4 hypothetical protein TTHERM_01001460 [Tetrahymena thermophila SB210]|eukprot:XP_001027495.4 hypothetical protein TTHERM_01001460 [Tetrahymena thermophila SB210]
MKLEQMINYKVSYEDQFKRFSLNASNTNFKEFCDKCIRIFNIQADQTILVNFYENDKQLIIRNEVDFALAVNANIHNNKQKSISFKISTVPAETQLSQSQVFDYKIQESVSKQGDSNNIEFTKEELQTILEKGLNDPDSDKILNQIADSISQSQEEIQIKYSSLMYIAALLKQKILRIRQSKYQYQQQQQNQEINQNELQNSTHQSTQNDNIYESVCNQDGSFLNNTQLKIKKLEGADIFEEFNASITSSQQNLKQSFENIFNQFNQSIQLLTQSMKHQVRINNDDKIQKKQYSNNFEQGENQKNQKINALSQFAFLSEYVDNIDEKLEAQEKQLIEEQDCENILITNLKDKIQEHAETLKRVSTIQNKESHQQKTNLFDNIIKQVDDGLDNELRGPFATENQKTQQNNDSNYQKIYNSN